MLEDTLDQKPGEESGGSSPVEGSASAEQRAGDSDSAWLALASRNYRDSTDWMNSALRKEWETAQAHFHGRHAPGSEFNTEAYRRRSRTFRPKTRMALRNGEAALAAAMFSTANLVEVTPEDEEDPAGFASAAVNKALLQYRLTKSIPWFLTAMGAFQDASLHGICYSYNYWEFQEVEYQVPAIDANGQPVVDMQTGEPMYETQRRIAADKPCIKGEPPENIRFDPGSDWRDPIQSSPYVIRLVPMSLSAAMEEIEKRAKMDGAKWRRLTRAQLLAGNKENQNDSTRQARLNQRPKPEDNQSGDNRTVWLHENFVRLGGEEFVYWTVGTEIMLSDPVPLAQVYFHGRRPITFGYVVVESHRPIPSGTATLIAPLVEASNKVGNQRFDNVQLVLNKRYFLRRGQQIDLEALMRNTPGGGVVMDDPDRDVKVLSTPDVTASSYQEQDRFDNQIDELSGTFSQTSVAQNNDLNKTLGGMQLVAGGASGISEYTIRTFVETWVENTLRQLMLLEQYYETDEVIRALAGKKAQLVKRFNVNDGVTDDLLIRDLVLNVNIGIGATNPQQKVQRLMYGLNAVAQIPGVAARIQSDPVIEEVFGALGYKSSERFFVPADQVQPQQDPMAEAEKLKQENMARQLDLKAKEIDQRARDAEAQRELEREIRYADIAAREGLTIKQLENKLQVTAIQDRTKRQTVALTESSRRNEMLLKERMGSGI